MWTLLIMASLRQFLNVLWARTDFIFVPYSDDNPADVYLARTVF